MRNVKSIFSICAIGILLGTSLFAASNFNRQSFGASPISGQHPNYPSIQENTARDQIKASQSQVFISNSARTFQLDPNGNLQEVVPAAISMPTLQNQGAIEWGTGSIIGSNGRFFTQDGRGNWQEIIPFSPPQISNVVPQQFDTISSFQNVMFTDYTGRFYIQNERGNLQEVTPKNGTFITPQMQRDSSHLVQPDAIPYQFQNQMFVVDPYGQSYLPSDANFWEAGDSQPLLDGASSQVFIDLTGNLYRKDANGNWYEVTAQPFSAPQQRIPYGFSNQLFVGSDGLIYMQDAIGAWRLVSDF